jgi:hypothetical protein
MFLYELQTIDTLAYYLKNETGIVTISGERATSAILGISYNRVTGSIKGTARFVTGYRESEGKPTTGMVLDIGSILNKCSDEIWKRRQEVRELKASR